MKFSIITATYNSEFSILDCIDSVNIQKYHDIEHIIIDGSSNDNTIEIITRNSNLVTVLISEKDNGIYDAMNKGIDLTNGDIIGILNSDDLYYDNNVLSSIADIFLNFDEIDAVYGNLVYVKRNDISKVVRYWRSFNYFDKFFDNGHVPPHPTLFLRKSVYLKYGKFSTQFNLAADYEFMLRIFKVYAISSKYLDITMVKMRLGGATSKNISNIIKQNLEIYFAWRVNGLLMPINFFFHKISIRLKQFFK